MLKSILAAALIAASSLVCAQGAATTPVTPPAPAASGNFKYNCLPAKPSDVQIGTSFDKTGAALGVWAYWFCPDKTFEWRATSIANINSSVLARFKAYRDGTASDIFVQPTLTEKDPTIAPMYADILRSVKVDVNNPMNAASAPLATTQVIKTNQNLCLGGPSPITQQTCSSAAGQQWDLLTPGKIKQNGNCLGFNGTTNGTTVSMLSCTSASTAFTWAKGVGTFKHTATGKCMDIDQAKVKIVGTKPQLWSCDGSGEQNFTK